MKKTNAMRLLDSEKIIYSIREYVIDEEKFLTVEDCKSFGMDPDRVYKTLVAKGDKNGINVFCVPLNCELNLKKAATVSENKKIEMVSMKDLLSITGYIRGGCSPIGMKKNFPTYIDETAQLFDEIGVSAGVKGSEISINPIALVDFLNGKFCDLT